MADLNTSDHLPLVADLSFNCNSPAPHSNEQTRLDWVQANKTGEITEYRQLVREKLSAHSVQVCLDERENIEAAVSFLSDTRFVQLNHYLARVSKGPKKPSRMPLCQPSALKAALLVKSGEKMAVNQKDLSMMKNAD